MEYKSIVQHCAECFTPFTENNWSCNCGSNEATQEYLDQIEKLLDKATWTSQDEIEFEKYASWVIQGNLECL